MDDEILSAPRQFERQSPDMIARARQLRKELSLPEKLLWRRLQSRNKHSFKIRRQFPVLNQYVIDFVYIDQMLAFEIDGKHVHEIKAEEDVIRQRAIESLGFAFVRIPARWVLRSPDEVADFILEVCAGEISLDEIDTSLR